VVLVACSPALHWLSAWWLAVSFVAVAWLCTVALLFPVKVMQQVKSESRQFLVSKFPGNNFPAINTHHSPSTINLHLYQQPSTGWRPPPIKPATKNSKQSSSPSPAIPKTSS
jgi:hypothetical protein